MLNTSVSFTKCWSTVGPKHMDISSSCWLEEADFPCPFFFVGGEGEVPPLLCICQWCRRLFRCRVASYMQPCASGQSFSCYWADVPYKQQKTDFILFFFLKKSIETLFLQEAWESHILFSVYLCPGLPSLSLHSKYSTGVTFLCQGWMSSHGVTEEFPPFCPWVPGSAEDYLNGLLTNTPILIWSSACEPRACSWVGVRALDTAPFGDRARPGGCPPSSSSSVGNPPRSAGWGTARYFLSYPQPEVTRR